MSLFVLSDGEIRVSERMVFAYKHVSPPFGGFNSRLAEHVEKLHTKFGRQVLEVFAHGILDGLAGGFHLFANPALLFERVALRRAQAEIGAEYAMSSTCCRAVQSMLVMMVPPGFSRFPSSPPREGAFRGHSRKNQCHLASLDGTGVNGKPKFRAFVASNV